jgi:hypothetical protein
MRKMGKRFYLFSQAEFGVSELMYTIPSFIDNGKKYIFHLSDSFTIRVIKV